MCVDKKQKRTFSKIFTDNYNENKKSIKCMYKDCHDKTINSHVIPKSMLEQSLSIVEDGRTVTYSYDILRQAIRAYSLDKNKYLLYNKNIKSSSIYNLFCKDHDLKIFESIENGNSDLNIDEYLFLMSYRFVVFENTFEKVLRMKNEMDNDVRDRKNQSKSSQDKYNFTMKFYQENIGEVHENLMSLKTKMESYINEDYSIDINNILKYFHIEKFKIPFSIPVATSIVDAVLPYKSNKYSDHCVFGLLPDYNGISSYFYILTSNRSYKYLNSTISQFKLAYNQGASNPNSSFYNNIKLMMIERSNNIVIHPIVYNRLLQEGKIDDLIQIKTDVFNNKLNHYGNYNEDYQNNKEELFTKISEIDLFSMQV